MDVMIRVVCAACDVQKRLAMISMMQQELLTLHSIFAKARVGDSDLCRVEAITALLFKSLITLRVPADLHILPQPAKFRGYVKGKRPELASTL